MNNIILATATQPCATVPEVASTFVMLLIGVAALFIILGMCQRPDKNIKD